MYDKVIYERLWVKTGQAKIKQENRKRKWRSIGQTWRKPQGTKTRQALSWNPHGAKGRRRPKNTRGRDLQKEMSNIGKSWRELETLAKDRRAWNVIVTGLCPHGN
jgi:hypothetical protein